MSQRNNATQCYNAKHEKSTLTRVLASERKPYDAINDDRPTSFSADAHDDSFIKQHTALLASM